MLLALHLMAFLAGTVIKSANLNDNVLQNDIPKLYAMDDKSTSQLEDIQTSKCRSSRYDILFFMRLPKCASTSMANLLQTLSKRALLGYYFHPSGAYNWNDKEIERVAAFTKRSAQINKNGLIYARHLYFTNFSSYGLQNYTYITIIRHPVDRFISSYLYYHFSSKQHIQAILDPKHRNETLQHCLQYQHSGCVHNLLTKYFCGHEEYCKDGSPRALQRAKSNLLKHFAVVGIAEEMGLSLKVLRSILPQYFSMTLQSNDLQRLNKNEHKQNTSAELRQLISEKNSADMKLYYYAKQLLQAKAVSCGIRLS